MPETIFGAKRSPEDSCFSL